jgi:hypothetical protein
VAGLSQIRIQNFHRGIVAQEKHLVGKGEGKSSLEILGATERRLGGSNQSG